MSKKLRRPEALEFRLMMTCAPTTDVPWPADSCWQNEELPSDVNNDGAVGPLDALIVINELTQHNLSDPQSGELPPLNSLISTILQLPESERPTIYDLDVNDDGFVSPIDALATINALREVPILDLNGDADHRFSPVLKLEWDADRLDLISDEAFIVGGNLDTLEGIKIRLPEGFPYDLELSVDTSNTNIGMSRPLDSIELTGVDSLENYRKVLNSLTLNASEAGVRTREILVVEIEVLSSDESMRTHIRVEIADFTEQLIGLPLATAQPWAESRFDDIRIIPPGTLITQDYLPERLNIFLDEFDIVASVRFG